MSPKTLVAFLAGLVVASGITFFVMRKPQPAAQSVALSKPAAQVAPSAPAVAETSPAATPSDAMASNVPRFPEHLQVSNLLRIGLGWVVIPGATLAIGTVPFLRDSANVSIGSISQLR